LLLGNWPARVGFVPRLAVSLGISIISAGGSTPLSSADTS